MFIHELCAFLRFFVRFTFRTKHVLAVFQGAWRLFVIVEFSITQLSQMGKLKNLKKLEKLKPYALQLNFQPKKAVGYNF